jgi:hypothetical protein
VNWSPLGFFVYPSNVLTLAQLAECIQTRVSGASIDPAFFDDRLSPCVRSALAKFLRVREGDVKALELGERFPNLPAEWVLRSKHWDLGSPDRFLQGRARYAFCPLCFQEMSRRTRTVWIRSEWACMFQTHCARHRTPLLERCAVCFTEDPLLPITNGSLLAPPCQIGCLNDTAEVRYGLEGLRGRIRERLEIASAGPEIETLLRRLGHILSDPQLETAPAFVTCFSIRGDDLAQWRAYSGGEGGYAIRFDPQKLAKSGLSNEILLHRVEYDLGNRRLF